MLFVLSCFRVGKIIAVYPDNNSKHLIQNPNGFCIVQTGLVSGNYDSAGGIFTRDNNPLNPKINLHDIQSVHRRERRVLRLIRPVGDRSAGKWLFIVRSILDP